MRRVLAAVAFATLTLGVVASCSLGDGTGAVRSDNLNAKDCWKGKYDLLPDFFAAVPFRDTLDIRIQRGSDLIGVSDGLAILVDDVTDVREQGLGQPIPVTLPAGVTPPGFAPGELCGTNCGGSGVHVAFYLLKSCHAVNRVLYGVSGTITFTELFSGDPNEDDAANKLIEGDFDIMVGDPQEIIAQGPDRGTVPNQSELTGRFRFFFERGQPAQPFP
ncbi:MAG: hypothetical protein U0414_20970 [Polyangiaceae bacterium]